MSILDWPDVLRAVGIDVYERPGWRTNQPLGPLQGLRAYYWHHDASPPGPSPGAWDWITSSYDAANPSAQTWLSYDGQWRFVGSGVAYHAGVTANSSDWNHTVGLETDHTVNEGYTKHQLDVIHRGFAAIAKHEGRGADFVTFHKVEARPIGRKTDPYLSIGRSPDDQSTWNAELNEQRGIIQAIIDGTQPKELFTVAQYEDIIAAIKAVSDKVDKLPLSVQQITSTVDNKPYSASQFLQSINEHTVDTQIRVRGVDKDKGEPHENYDMLQDILGQVSAPKG